VLFSCDVGSSVGTPQKLQLSKNALSYFFFYCYTAGGLLKIESRTSSADFSYLIFPLSGLFIFCSFFCSTGFVSTTCCFCSRSFLSLFETSLS
jgi:hypothetical protein